jgi:hypothetical protein
VIGTVTKWLLVVYAAGLARYGVAVVGEHKTEAQCRQAALSLSAPPTYWSCIPVRRPTPGTSQWPDRLKPLLPFMPPAERVPTRHSCQLDSETAGLGHWLRRSRGLRRVSLWASRLRPMIMATKATASSHAIAAVRRAQGGACL